MRVTLAGQVGVAGHLTDRQGRRCDGADRHPQLGASRVVRLGYPAIDNRDWLKASAIFRKLPELQEDHHDLERRIAELEARPAAPEPRSRRPSRDTSPPPGPARRPV